MDHILCGGSQLNDDLMNEAAAYGVILPDHLQQSKDFVLWADHLPAVELFMRCLTQWRSGPNGLIGLDYGVVLEMAKLYQTPHLPETMEDLQVMEVRARELLNEKG